jgi:glycyl-tRNA synthetase beta chain
VHPLFSRFTGESRYPWSPWVPAFAGKANSLLRADTVGPGMNPAQEATSDRVDDPGRGELLLELLSEEIPARMQQRAIEVLRALVRDKLAMAEIPPAEIRGYATPRRLVVIAEGIPATQPDHTEERRGPRKGAPQAALDGFLRSAGLAAIEECEIRDTGRGEFYFAIARRSGRATAAVLPALIAAAIAELPWPKSMRWPLAALRWVRPLRSVICIYDGNIVPLAIDGIAVGRTTRGHRFLSPGEFCADSAAEYLEKLQHAYVILDQDRRRELIRADLDRRAAELGVIFKSDPGLLDEVTGLVEFPLVLAGAIDPDFMTLPPEVLQTAMRAHQKYFSCLHPDGRPAPHFLFVADNLPGGGGATTIAGNERVLRARLADARFFWDQDRKVRLEDRVDALKDRVYHAKLGSVYDKTRRLERLTAFLAENVRFPDHSLVTPAETGVHGKRSDAALDSRFRGNDAERVRHLAGRAAHLAKADLSTGMVGEFPDLQGVMGRYYALHDGEDQSVADAIADHYKPLGPADACPTAPVSVAVALADKLDALVAFFAIGERPTGTRDPFALRRAAQGVIRLVLENELRLPLRYSLIAVARLVPIGGQEIMEEHILADELLAFIADRLKVHLREQGVRHDLIAAVFALGEDDLVRLLARVDALSYFLGTDDGSNLLVAYRRAANIVAIEQRRGGWTPGQVNAGSLRQPEEAALVAGLERLVSEFSEPRRQPLQREDFQEAMVELARLRAPVDAFFDHVTVNTDDPALRENRLRLLARIRDTMNQVADFSQIEG